MSPACWQHIIEQLSLHNQVSQLLRYIYMCMHMHMHTQIHILSCSLALLLPLFLLGSSGFKKRNTHRGAYWVGPPLSGPPSWPLKLSEPTTFLRLNAKPCSASSISCGGYRSLLLSEWESTMTSIPTAHCALHWLTGTQRKDFWLQIPITSYREHLQIGDSVGWCSSNNTRTTPQTPGTLISSSPPVRKISAETLRMDAQGLSRLSADTQFCLKFI